MNYRTFFSKLLLINLFLNSTLSIYSMNYAQSAKNGLSMFCKGAHWSILSYPAYEAYKEFKIVKSDEKRPSEATKEQEVFVKETLKEHNFAASLHENVKIQTAISWASQPNALYIQEHFDPNDTDKERVDMAKACIIHEAGHIQNRDMYRGWLVSTAMPFIMHFGTKALFSQSGIQSLSLAKKLLLIPSAAIKLFFADMVTVLYRRHRESKADDEIVKRVEDPSILKAISEAFSYKYKRAYGVENLPETVTWRDRLDWVFEEPIHPFILDRMKKMDDACKVLESKQIVPV